MKLGTFLLGGLAGAAVMMLMRNRTMSAVTESIGLMLKHRTNQIKETALEKGINLKFGDGTLGSAMMGGSSGRQRASSRDDDLDEVKHIASKDPKVKHEVNEILQNNGHHTI